MPTRTVKEVSQIVRKYFDDIKKSKFIFDIINIDHEEADDEWLIECEVANVFQEAPRRYYITVDDSSGEILSVAEAEYVEDEEEDQEE